MKVTKDVTRTSYFRGIYVEDVPQKPVVGYSHQGKEYLPSHISIKWTDVNDPFEVQVSGPLLKKDGTLSERAVKCRYAINAKDACRSVPYAPDWLLELIK